MLWTVSGVSVALAHSPKPLHESSALLCALGACLLQGGSCVNTFPTQEQFWEGAVDRCSVCYNTKNSPSVTWFRALATRLARIHPTLES